MQPFLKDSNCVLVSATTTSTAQPMVSGGTVSPSPHCTVTVEPGGNTVFVNFGTSTVTATVPTTSGTYGSIPVLAGTQVSLGKPVNATYVSVITRAGTASVYVQPGNGL